MVGLRHEETGALSNLSSNRPASPGQGIVHIVGAGPGDADLLTLRALKLLRQADVVFHDRLIGPEVLPRDTRTLLIDKADGNPCDI